jgi:hypothetical protein
MYVVTVCYSLSTHFLSARINSIVVVDVEVENRLTNVTLIKAPLYIRLDTVVLGYFISRRGGEGDL